MLSLNNYNGVKKKVEFIGVISLDYNFVNSNNKFKFYLRTKYNSEDWECKNDLVC